jgi:DNA-binding transcriptional MerR regulator
MTAVKVSGSAAAAPPAESEQVQAPCQLLAIGPAAARAGVSERALRYYQQLGLITPSGRTPGGMRRYSEEDLARVGRIRELQDLLGLNLDEIAVVLRSDDRMAEIRSVYSDEHTGVAERRLLARESLELQENLRETVESKRASLDAFLIDIYGRLERIRDVLKELDG